MIRINLLTEKKRKAKKEEGAKGPFGILLGIVLVTLGTLLVVGFGVFFLQSKVSHLTAQSKTNKAVLENLSRKINEMKRFDVLNKEFDQKSTLIETLRKNQSVPVKLLDIVTFLLPEGVWLSSLSYTGDKATIEGLAFTNIDIVTFVESLKKAAAVSDVYLEESKQTEVEKVSVYKFKLNFKMRV